MFLENILIKANVNKAIKYLKNFFTAILCYKIYLEDYLKKNYIKIIPIYTNKIIKKELI